MERTEVARKCEDTNSRKKLRKEDSFCLCYSLTESENVGTVVVDVYQALSYHKKKKKKKKKNRGSVD